MDTQRTPLNVEHLCLGAKMTVFGGWEMPVSYSSILKEHQAVREKAGVFDVSHMGKIFVSGEGAAALLNLICTNEMADMESGRSRYSPLCNEQGGIIDDVIVYRYQKDNFLIIANAGNTARVLSWLTANAQSIEDVTITDKTQDYALIAVQGPASRDFLSNFAPKLPERYYTFLDDAPVFWVRCMIARTGYTGELGYEILVPRAKATLVWQGLMANASEYGILPCGLGARDTLRFEAGMPLYGHELELDTTPIEAGLGRFVRMDKSAFFGKAALSRPAVRKLIGLEMVEQGIPRQGYGVFDADTGEQVGSVTSGMFAPTLGKNMAMALVGRVPENICVQIRGKMLAAREAALPFYKRNK